jgi:hypothetical protein
MATGRRAVGAKRKVSGEDVKAAVSDAWADKLRAANVAHELALARLNVERAEALERVTALEAALAEANGSAKHWETMAHAYVERVRSGLGELSLSLRDVATAVSMVDPALRNASGAGQPPTVEGLRSAGMIVPETPAARTGPERCPAMVDISPLFRAQCTRYAEHLGPHYA